MLVLIDVTSRKGTILIQNEENRFISWEAKNHAETLGLQISNINKEQAITKMGVVTGPGSFTGIRIGIAFSMGFCATGKIPLYSCSKFDLAWSHIQKKNLSLDGVFFPGPRGKAYTQTRPDEPIEIRNLADLPETWMGDLPSCSPEKQIPPLLPIFADLIKTDRLSPTEEPVPLYVRPPDAKVGVPLLERLLQS